MPLYGCVRLLVSFCFVLTASTIWQLGIKAELKIMIVWLFTAVQMCRYALKNSCRKEMEKKKEVTTDFLPTKHFALLTVRGEYCKMSFSSWKLLPRVITSLKCLWKKCYSCLTNNIQHCIGLHSFQLEPLEHPIQNI